MILDALKKHIDCAEAVLAETGDFSSEDPMTWTLDLKGVDIVCKEGVSWSFYEKVNNWLKGKPGRRLFFIEDQFPRLKALTLHPNALLLLNNPCVKIFFLESPIQKDAIAKKIGWLCAFKQLHIVGENWAKLIEPYHLAAHSIASDAADFGVGVLRHLKLNHQRPLRNLASLKGSLKGIPAVICGAGPSLEQNGHLLNEWKGNALLIAAGSSIHSIKTAPDLAVAFDPHSPVVRKQYFDVPLCMQSRVHPDSFIDVTGDLLYFPEAHFAFEAWIAGLEEPFDSGWTAGTAGVAIAAHLGCSPIVLVGMDYCYRGKQKYADQKKQGSGTPLVRVEDGNGAIVWTQRDWLLAISWLEQFALSHPETSCINGTMGGMEIPGFPRATFTPTSQLNVTFDTLFKSSKSLPNSSERLRLWLESLQRCHRTELTEIPDDEIAQELLLEPLWQIWAPLFERELMADLEPISMAEKMAIQKFLFFNQVIEEHLHVE
jgi:hypothetical protein